MRRAGAHGPCALPRAVQASLRGDDAAVAFALAEAGRVCDTILLMMRRVTYRSAVTAFVFTGLWFVLGLLLLWSPIPGSLGIRAEMLVAWLMLFLLIMAIAGAMLTLASYNDMFPAG